MNVKVLSIGKTKEAYIREGLKVYCSRIARYIHFEWIELADVKHSNKLDPETLKSREAKAFLHRLQPSEFAVLLDETGKEKSSVEIAEFIDKKMLESTKTLVFIIGGAYGFAPELKVRANDTLRLSKMTFSHQLVRLLFAEQLYRAFTIIRGEPYHNP